MSLAVCQSPMPTFTFDLHAFCAPPPAAADLWLEQHEEAIRKEAAEKKDGQFDIWAAIQSSSSSEKPSAVTSGDLPAAAAVEPYVHPLVRRSASSLSQRSLEICTESLGSETGSDGFEEDHEDYYFSELSSSSFDQIDAPVYDNPAEEETRKEEETEPVIRRRGRELAAVNYHCSIGKGSSARSFPPPLPSISRRDGPCLSMRPHRRDGRLLVQAVPVPSQNYLHARRHDGRLLLTFIDTTFQDIYTDTEFEFEPQLQETTTEEEEVEEEEGDDDDGRLVIMEEEEEEAEEEVEVVDRGIVVEVKVSRPPPPQSVGVKVQRSSVVINKFVGVPTTTTAAATDETANTSSDSTTTTATAVVAAAVAASSSPSTDGRYWRDGGKKNPAESSSAAAAPEKMFFTSKRMMNRQELVHQLWRCSQHLRPLFIYEPCCITTS